MTNNTATYLIERIDTTTDNSRYDAFLNGRGILFATVVGDDAANAARRDLQAIIRSEGSGDLIRVTQI